MSKITDWLRLTYLITTAKIGKVLDPIVKFISVQDVTFIFLFFALKLFGYPWNWVTLLASLGAWFVIKDLFKHLKYSLSEIGRK
jgi:hypothetical protein